jgi:glutamate---cysteine ligase / carboxylate-amine ligase
MSSPLPDWATWNAAADRPAWTVGIEEEVMLLDPATWALAHRIDTLLPELSRELVGSVSAETHACTLELATGVHLEAGRAIAELYALRVALDADLGPLGLRAAVAGTHPLATGEDVEVSAGARYQLLHRGLRELARREPTFALHVHVGVPDPELAIRAADQLRAHLPLVLAVSANSPFWRGRDSGMASVRTPLFQAFPRAGLPRRFGSYEAYVATVDTMLRAEAFPEPTFLWWDVRLQPRFGTVEVRVADAASRVAEAGSLAALIQTLVRLEATGPLASERLVSAPEVLDENRFLAARDGMRARLIDPAAGIRVPAAEQLARLLESCREHAQDLGCEDELEAVAALARHPGAERQRRLARHDGLSGVTAALSDAFLDAGPVASAPASGAGAVTT